MSTLSLLAIQGHDLWSLQKSGSIIELHIWEWKWYAGGSALRGKSFFTFNFIKARVVDVTIQSFSMKVKRIFLYLTIFLIQKNMSGQKLLFTRYFSVYSTF